MLVEADPETAWVKRWLATEDQRTRPDHREADGQTVPFGGMFVVGGYLMSHPHDPTAPAKEVVNCRCVELLEIENEPTEMGNRQYKGPPNLAASGITLMQASCVSGEFCLQTHKPGLCKGQHRGDYEPGTQDQNKTTPVQKAQVAVKGLTDAIARAQAIAAANAQRDPKMAALARKAVADYSKALQGHQQTLRKAAQANATNKRTADRDARDQDRLDAQGRARAKRQHDSLEKRADAILKRRQEKAKLAKMTPKQRAAYHRQKAAAAKVKRQVSEDNTLRRAGRK
jgi:hypothetical protein